MKLIKNKFTVWILALSCSGMLYLLVTPRSLYSWLLYPLLPVPPDGEKLRLMLLAGFLLLHLLTAFLFAALTRGSKLIQVLAVGCLVLNYYAFKKFSDLGRRVLDVYPQHGEKPDTPRWNSVCTVDNAAIAVTSMNISLALEQSGVAPLVTRVADSAHYLALSMPRCRVEPLKIDPATLDAPPTIVSSGRALLRAGGRWSVLDTELGSWIPPVPSSVERPVLSDDGAWVGWLAESELVEPVAGPTEVEDSSATEYVIELAGTYSKESRQFSLKKAFTDRDLSRAQLLAIDPSRYEAVISLGDSEFAAVGLDGSQRWGPIKPRAQLGKEKTPVDNIIIAPDAFRTIFGGWVAWGRRAGSREQLLFWDLPRGIATVVLDKDSTVTGVTVSPDGRFVAVSQQLAKGDRVGLYLVREATLLIERKLPAGSAARVAFLGEDHFAYSHLSADGDTTKSVTYVLELEQEAPFFNASIATIRMHERSTGQSDPHK